MPGWSARSSRSRPAGRQRGSLLGRRARQRERRRPSGPRAAARTLRGQRTGVAPRRRAGGERKRVFLGGSAALGQRDLARPAGRSRWAPLHLIGAGHLDVVVAVGGGPRGRSRKGQDRGVRVFRPARSAVATWAVSAVRHGARRPPWRRGRPARRRATRRSGSSPRPARAAGGPSNRTRAQSAGPWRGCGSAPGSLHAAGPARTSPQSATGDARWETHHRQDRYHGSRKAQRGAGSDSGRATVPVPSRRRRR